jgi:hypothetical protein
MVGCPLRENSRAKDILLLPIEPPKAEVINTASVEPAKIPISLHSMFRVAINPRGTQGQCTKALLTVFTRRRTEDCFDTKEWVGASHHHRLLPLRMMPVWPPLTRFTCWLPAALGSAEPRRNCLLPRRRTTSVLSSSAGWRHKTTPYTISPSGEGGYSDVR